MFIELSKGTVVNTLRMVYISKADKTWTIHLTDGTNLTVIDPKAIMRLQ